MNQEPEPGLLTRLFSGAIDRRGPSQDSCRKDGRDTIGLGFDVRLA